jgi:hypothetical protein
METSFIFESWEIIERGCWLDGDILHATLLAAL